MDRELIKKLDAEIERGTYSSRSHAIEVCVKQKFKFEEVDKRISDFLIELMDLAAKSPELVDVYKKALRAMDYQ